LLAVCPELGAEPVPLPPAEVMHITQAGIKPGGMPALARNRAAVGRALDTINSPRTTIALTSITGAEEVWLIDFCAGLGDLEQDRQLIERAPGLRNELDTLSEQEADFFSTKGGVIGLFLKHLSYRLETCDWSQVRYVEIITAHVRPGKHPEYLEYRRMSQAAHNKGGIEGPLLVYKINGYKGLVWMIFRPLKSLRQHDELRAQGFGEPLTPEEDRKMVELRATSYEYSENRFFRVDPQMSQVPRRWSEINPAFWRPSPN